MPSSGFKKDTLVIMFCLNTLLANESDDAKTDKELLNRDNKSHKTNKRINRRITSLKKQMHYHLEEVKRKYDVLWTNGLPLNKLDKVVKLIDKPDISLELLVTSIMFVNFIERKKPLDESMSWTKEIDYMMLFDLMDETCIGEANRDMLFLAYEVVEVLKS